MTTLKDLRFALRLLRKNWTLTAIAVVTLGVGIAINATVFSWIDSVRFHPFPGVRNPGELALVETETSASEVLVATSYLDYRDYRDNLKLVSGLAIGRFTPLSMGSGGRTERAWAELVSANYFDVLGVKPELGRTFLPEEGADKPGAFPVAVISHRLWKSRFQGDPGVLGKTIRLNRHEITIVGVAPPVFRGTIAGLVYDVWMPITMATAMGTGPTLNYRGCRDLTSTIARLKPGVTIEQAGAEIATLARRLAATYPETNRGVDATMVPVWAGHWGAQGLLLKPLRILMALSLLLLLIVCANVANLLLARAVTRQKEFSIRLALGAHASRVARQLLTETLVLASAAAGLGAILVLWMGRSLALLLPPTDMTFDAGGGLNPDTLGFTLLIAVAATLISGTAPALLVARADLNEMLKEGGRSGTFGRHSHRLRSVLVYAEVGLATVALIGAGLFFRSFQNASGIRPGFDMSNISSSQFYLSYAGYSADEQQRFCRMLRERLEAIPGVIGVTYTDWVPLGSVAGTSPMDQLAVPGYTPARDEQMLIHRATVPPGYFDLLHIPLLEGRDFTESDDETKPAAVIIVNQAFARRYFHGASPVGRNVSFGGGSATVVGVVKDSKYHVLTEGPIPFFYLPFRQWFAPGLNFSVLLKTTGDPMRLEPVLRREALALNPDAVFHTTTMAELATASLYPQRVAASLLTVVGIVCVLLAGMGLYSVMSYAVSQRTQELGVRIALGARPADVLGLVVWEGLRLTIPGLLVGVVIAALAARTVGSMLVEISSFDPLTFISAVVFLTLVAMLASYMPARRATRLDPVLALRFD